MVHGTRPKKTSSASASHTPSTTTTRVLPFDPGKVVRLNNFKPGGKHMPVTVKCPSCGLLSRAPDSLLPGQQVKCPKCSTAFSVPLAAERAVSATHLELSPLGSSAPRAARPA